MDNPNPLLRPYCWIQEHDWIDDPFMGDGQECDRCGAFDRDYTGTQEMIVHGALLVGFIVGAVFGAAVALGVVWL